MMRVGFLYHPKTDSYLKHTNFASSIQLTRSTKEARLCQHDDALLTQASWFIRNCKDHEQAMKDSWLLREKFTFIEPRCKPEKYDQKVVFIKNDKLVQTLANWSDIDKWVIQQYLQSFRSRKEEPKHYATLVGDILHIEQVAKATGIHLSRDLSVGPVGHIRTSRYSVLDIPVKQFEEAAMMVKMASDDYFELYYQVWSDIDIEKKAKPYLDLLGIKTRFI